LCKDAVTMRPPSGLKVDELFAQKGDAAGAEFRQEPGSRRLANQAGKGAAFRAVIAHPGSFSPA
jgi:hypothetical protein